ncbi:hypothetical protein IGI04_005601 [Brassica rapa subsp. trilocularis]|nr:hypothetical protein IGI04_005601 [Brassica rapa subsp. trilocularis]
MQNLSIMNVSRHPIIKNPFHNSKPAHKSTLQLPPSRQSSRKCKRERLMISEGSTLEVYMKHEKQLGNTERSWICFVDGCGESLPKENNVVLISSSSESERVFSYK